MSKLSGGLNATEAETCDLARRPNCEDKEKGELEISGEVGLQEIKQLGTTVCFIIGEESEQSGLMDAMKVVLVIESGGATAY